MMHCAYASALLEAVDFALTKNRNLFSDSEVHQLRSFSQLSYDSIRIYGRLVTRKTKWVKSIKLEEYIQSKMSDGDANASIANNVNEETTLATKELIGANFMENLGSKKEFDEVWEIAQSSFGADDWSWLTHRLNGGKPKSGLRKDEVIRFLRRTIETQQTCFGKSLKDRFVDVVRELSNSVHHSDWVRLSNDTLILVRRTQRLLQAPSEVSGASDVSAFRPLEICVPLFATFKLIKLPSYEQSKTPASHHSWIFPSDATFHHWEAAVELRSLISELDMVSHQRDAYVSEDLQLNVQKVLREGVLCPAASRSMYMLFWKLLCPHSLNSLADSFLSSNSSTLPITCYITEIFTGLALQDSEREKNVQQNMKVMDASEMGFQISVLGLLMLMAQLLSDDADLAAEEEEYLLRYRAVSQLCGCVSYLASECEKRTMKQHLLAVLLYELLLCMPSKFHTIQIKNRGSWCKRVIVNLDLHLKRPLVALAVAKQYQSLYRKGELSLLESDVVDFADRVKSLSQRLINQLSKGRSFKRDNSTSASLNPELDVRNDNALGKKRKLRTNANEIISSRVEKRSKLNESNENVCRSPKEADIMTPDSIDIIISLVYEHLLHGGKDSSRSNGSRVERVQLLCSLILHQLLKLQNSHDDILDNCESVSITKNATMTRLVDLLRVRPCFAQSAKNGVPSPPMIPHANNAVTKSVSSTQLVSPPGLSNSLSINSLAVASTIPLENSWQCIVCTFMNSARFKLSCAMCGQRRSASTTQAKRIEIVTKAPFSSSQKLPSTEVDDDLSVIELLSQTTEDSMPQEEMTSNLPKESTTKLNRTVATRVEPMVDVLDLDEEDSDESEMVNVQSLNWQFATTCENWMHSTVAIDWQRDDILQNLLQDSEENASPSESDLQPQGTSDIRDIVDIINSLRISAGSNTADVLLLDPTTNLVSKEPRMNVHDWSVSAFTVHGRRQFLNPKKSSSIAISNINADNPASNNTGKSRFYLSRTDAFGTVEDLVQDKCQFFDTDELDLEDGTSDDKDEVKSLASAKIAASATSSARTSALRRFVHVSYRELFHPRTAQYGGSAVQGLPTTGDGWQGWHCEGSIVRCLVGLLLWDCVFYPVATPPVLLTPYQTAPLDFGHPSFFRRRKLQILQRVQQLMFGELSRPSQLMIEIQRLFLAHKGCVARHLGGLLNAADSDIGRSSRTAVGDASGGGGGGGVSLRLLQLLALCLGPPCLARLCLAVARGHSQWRSGAPDLLLLRVSLSNKANCDDRECLSLESLLGAHWQQLHNSSAFNGRSRETGDDNWLEGDLYKPPLPSAASRSSRKQPAAFSSNETNTARGQARNHRLNNVDFDRVAEGDEEDVAESYSSPNVRPASSSNDDPLLTPLSFPEYVMNKVSSHGGYQLEFQAMFVEVKGPTDSLAYKQWLWLHLLNLRTLSAQSTTQAQQSMLDEHGSAYYCEAADLRSGADQFTFATVENTSLGIAKQECNYVQLPVQAYVCLVKEDSLQQQRRNSNSNFDRKNQNRDSISSSDPKEMAVDLEALIDTNSDYDFQFVDD